MQHMGNIISSSIVKVCMRETLIKLLTQKRVARRAPANSSAKNAGTVTELSFAIIMPCPFVKSIIPRPVRKKPLRSTTCRLSRKLHLHENIIIETLTCMQSDKITVTSSWKKYYCVINNEDTTAPTIELIGFHSAAWMAAATRTKGPVMHTTQ